MRLCALKEPLRAAIKLKEALLLTGLVNLTFQVADSKQSKPAFRNPESRFFNK